VVRGLVHEQQVGRAHQRLCDRETLAPPSGERGRRFVRIHETAAAERNAHLRIAFGVVEIVAGERVQQHLRHRAIVGEKLVLRDVGEPCHPAQRHGAAVGFLYAGEHAQQRRLATPVRPDQADAVALVNPKGKVGEQRHCAVRLRDLLTSQQQRHANRPDG
jgi:hypothetical protein